MTNAVRRSAPCQRSSPAFSCSRLTVGRLTVVATSGAVPGRCIMRPLATTVAALALVLTVALQVHAGLRVQCRFQCDAAVAACVTTTGQRFRPCRRQTLRRCRHEGLQVCAPSATTTTTTVPEEGLPTTTQPHGAPTTVPYGSTT